jgi:uncharacterized protein with HEPN domain
VNKDRIYVEHILKNIAHVQRLTAESEALFFENEDTQAAVLYYLQTMAESVTRLSDSIQQQHPQIAWAQIRGFRNLIVHDYLGINLKIVWEIIQVELPALKTVMSSILRMLESDDTEL